MWHPNSMFVVISFSFFPNLKVYANGEVCISILHPPGEDPNMYESSLDRWSPVQSVEKILISVVSMLAGIFSLFTLGEKFKFFNFFNYCISFSQSLIARAQLMWTPL